MLSGSESCIKRIKTFKSKRPKNRLALKKSLLRFQLIKIEKNTFGVKRTLLLLSSLKKYTSRPQYDLNLILNYRMFVVI